MMIVAFCVLPKAELSLLCNMIPLLAADSCLLVSTIMSRFHRLQVPVVQFRRASGTLLRLCIPNSVMSNFPFFDFDDVFTYSHCRSKSFLILRSKLNLKFRLCVLSNHQSHPTSPLFINATILTQ